MIGQLLGGRYQITDVFNSGVFGQTYLVEDNEASTPTKYVIRQLRLHSKTEEALKCINGMLKQRLPTLEILGTHSQIPSIVAHFEDEENFYLVEELIDGHPLSEELMPHRPLSSDRVVEILQEVLNVLAFIHSHRQVHQCIQPTTLIRRKQDDRLVLAGSGIMREISAQLLKARQSEQPVLIHTSAYMPPEQVQGQPPHAGIDIYALGIVGIQALTGLQANALSRLRTLNPHFYGGEPSWHHHANASPELLRILDKMVHVNHRQRYQTTREVLADLEKVVTNDATTIVLPTADKTALETALPEETIAEDPVRTPQPHKPKLLAWVGGATAMLVAGVAIALVTGQLPLASGYFSNITESKISTLPSKSGTQSSSQSSSQASPSKPRLLNSLKLPFQGNTPEQKSKELFQEGMQYAKSGDSQAAINSLTQAIQANPKNAQAHYQRANLRLQLGDRKGAIQDYTEAIQTQPDLVPAYVNRGSAQAEQGNDKSAIADYTQAIQQDPKLMAAYLNRCLAHSNVGNQVAAVADCTEAISLEPANTLAYQNRGLAHLRKGDFVAAIKDFNIAMKLTPKDPEPYYNRGLAREELKDRLGAIADYTQAIKLHPEHVLAHYDRGLARAEEGDREGAIADLQKSAQLCLNLGRSACYSDAQYHIKRLQQSLPSP